MATYVGVNFQLLQDRLASRDYSPSTEISEIVNTLRLTNRGEAGFYATPPQLQSKAEFNETCGLDGSENNYTLGCYRNGDSERIYIYNPETKMVDENGVYYDFETDRDVTALHEMLHAVYGRLDSSEQASACDDLRIIEKDVDGLSAELEIYDESQYCSEAFARVGSEYLVRLGDSDAANHLKTVYDDYFEVNEELLESYWHNIEQSQKLVETIASSNAALDLAKGRLRGEINDYYRNSTDEKYLNVQSQILQYNDMVATHNSLVATARKIRDGLDSEQTSAIENYLAN
jgi:hypothetical protein